MDTCVAANVTYVGNRLDEVSAPISAAVKEGRAEIHTHQLRFAQRRRALVGLTGTAAQPPCLHSVRRQTMRPSSARANHLNRSRLHSSRQETPQWI